MPVAVLGPGDTAVNKTESPVVGTFFRQGRQTVTMLIQFIICWKVIHGKTKYYKFWGQEVG